MSAQRPDLINGNAASYSVTLEGRDGLDQRQDQARYTLSVIWRPDESLMAVSDLCQRDRQCANTLGGSDTTHQVASSS